MNSPIASMISVSRLTNLPASNGTLDKNRSGLSLDNRSESRTMNGGRSNASSRTRSGSSSMNASFALLSVSWETKENRWKLNGLRNSVKVSSCATPHSHSGLRCMRSQIYEGVGSLSTGN